MKRTSGYFLGVRHATVQKKRLNSSTVCIRSEALITRRPSLLRIRRLPYAKVKMIMVSASGVKTLATGRTLKFAMHVLIYS